MLRDLRARAAEQQRGKATGTPTADDDHVGVDLVGNAEKYRHRTSVAQLRAMVHLSSGERRAPRGFECHPDLVAVSLRGHRCAAIAVCKQAERVHRNDLGAERARASPAAHSVACRPFSELSTPTTIRWISMVIPSSRHDDGAAVQGAAPHPLVSDPCLVE